jgi:hypothetical protein
MQIESHGYEEQGVPRLSPELDVVVEGRRFDTRISAEAFYYKVGTVKSYSSPHIRS